MQFCDCTSHQGDANNNQANFTFNLEDAEKKPHT